MRWRHEVRQWCGDKGLSALQRRPRGVKSFTSLGALQIPHAKLSRRLFLLTSIALAPAAAILFYNVSTTRAAIETEIHQSAFRAGQLAALEMQRILSGARDVLVSLAAAPVVQRFDPAGCSLYLRQVGESLPQFAGIAVLDREGIIRCRQDDQGLGVSLSDRSYVQQTRDSGRFFVGEYTEGRISGRAVLPMALPIRLTSGETTGTVVGTLDLGWLADQLRRRDYAKDSALTIADRNGVILAREPLPERFVGTKIPERFRYLFEGTTSGTVEVTSQDGTQRILGYFPPRAGPAEGLYISAGISTEDAYAALWRTTTFGLAMAIVGLVGSYLLAWLTSRHLVRRPVDRLVMTIQAWRNGQEEARTGMTGGTGEFGIVGTAIDEFMDELVASRQQRRKDEQLRELLVGELDHRVKNLLATVQAVARQSFQDLSGSSDALETFSKRLNALAAAHQLLMSGEWQGATMRSLVETATAPFNGSGQSAFSFAGPDLTVQSKVAMALSMALHELCTNAVKYGALSRAEGRVEVVWEVIARPSEEKGLLSLEWKESGGPQVVPPARTGFGSRMIQRILSAETGGAARLEYDSEGLVCRITAPVDKVVQP